MYPWRLTPAAGRKEYLRRIIDADYQFVTEVHYVHGPRKSPTALTVETCGLGFHIENPKFEPRSGQLLEGEGTLFVDFPSGMETVYGFWIPRDISRKLRVLAIWAVPIPERFIVRREEVVSFPRYPAVLRPGEYDSFDKMPVSSMRGRSGPPFEWEFFLVEFEDEGPTRNDWPSRTLDYLLRKTLMRFSGQ